MRPVLFLVPARGGSVRVPGKNLRTVAGIPLVAWGVRIARAAAAGVAGGPHPVVCSTDDPAIAEVAAEWGATIVDRPADLATATATSAEVARHALAMLDDLGPFRALVLVQPTSPLTDPADVRAAVERFDALGGRRGVVSVTRTHPAAFHVDARLAFAGAAGEDRLLTGGFYVVEPEAFRADPRFVVPGATEAFEVTPSRSVDVDEAHDLVAAEALAAARPVAAVPFGDRLVGEGPVLVIADTTASDEPTLVHRRIDGAADAGVDAVHVQASGLPAEAWPGLARHAADRGLLLVATVSPQEIARGVVPSEIAALRVPPAAVSDPALLAGLGRLGRPLVLSNSGVAMAGLAAAVDAMEAAASGRAPIVALEAGAAGSPRTIATLRAAFGVPVGWSDQRASFGGAIAAAALGAAFLSVPLALDGDTPAPPTALDGERLGQLVAAVREVEAPDLDEPATAARVSAPDLAGATS